MDVCHKCANTKCINPEHLFLGTRLENMRDAVSKGRQAKGMNLPQSKLTEKDKNEIVKRAMSGELYRDIAKDFGVCRQVAGMVSIKHGIRRKNGCIS